MTHWNVLGRCFVLSVALIHVGGCGSGKQELPSGKVSGKLTLAGAAPNEPGLQFTLFEKSRGKSVSAALSPDGQFTFDRPVPVGDYTVVVSPPAPSQAAGAEPPPEVKTKIPQKYRSETSSDKTVKIESKDNVLSIELE